jgi:hypothetical protein
MTDKILETLYTAAATTYILENYSEGQALFLAGVQYGLDQRDQEVEDLKQRITELGG